MSRLAKRSRQRSNGQVRISSLMFVDTLSAAGRSRELGNDVWLYRALTVATVIASSRKAKKC